MVRRLGKPPVLPSGRTVPLSPAVEANGFLFVSGQLGFDTSGKLVDGCVQAQTRSAIENLKTVLMDAGADLSDVVKIVGWLTNASDFPDFNEVYGEYFSSAPPARSMVVSSLLIPGAVVEIEAIAVSRS